MLHTLSEALVRFGPSGVFLLAVLDSSGVPMPAAMDILVMFVAYKSPDRAYFTAAMAVLGSLGGNLALFLLSRHGVRRFFKPPMPGKPGRFREWFDRYGLVTVFIPALLPVPPLPLKAFVISAGVLRTPLAQFAAVILVARVIRYFGEAYLGIRLGLGAQDYVKHNAWALTGVAVGLALVMVLLLRMAERRRARRYNRREDPPSSMPKRIAIVEDEAELASLIDYNLTRHGYQTQILRGDKGTLEELERAKPDLIVLDVMLPDVDGFQLCREIRQSQAMARTPVIFLTARGDEVDRVLGLEIGGDDYITKPFSPRELVARVKAHLRREQMDAEPAVTGIGPFRLDRTGRRVYVGERELTLTSTEFNLLEFFLSHPGRAYSRDQLLDAVWGQSHYVTPRTVDVHVRRLREQIEGQPESPRYLTTVRGFGYRFEDTD